MIPPLEPSDLPGPAQRIISEDAPQKLRLMAAKGVVPGLRPEAILSVLWLLGKSADEDVARQAAQTLDELPDPLLKGAIQADLPPALVLALAERYVERLDVLERLVRMRQRPIEAIEHIAERGSEAATELVATNQELLLRHPNVIELLYMNKNARMSTVNRLVELAVRNKVELHGIPAWKEIAQAIKNELIVDEPLPEAMPEDHHFWETDALARELEDEETDDAFWEDEGGEEHLQDKLKPLHARLSDMSVSEKIRAATLGTREERMLLVREQNRLVASAAARSPLMQEPEVALIARNRGVVEDVLRIIGNTSEWSKSYQIKRNLVENPKTPIAIAQKLIVQLRESDLRRIAKSKNIAGAVQQAARRHLERRKN
jgi:hypothetical protein